MDDSKVKCYCMAMIYGMFRTICRRLRKMNLVTMKLFSLQALYYGTIWPALERDICLSVWRLSGHCTAITCSGQVHSLP